MTSPVSVTFEDGIAVIRIDNPPVNAIGHAVRLGLVAAVDEIAASDATAAVLACAGSTFVAGADITEFGKPIPEPLLPDVIAKLEACPVPITAAIQGTALGGGLELALGCGYRVAHETAKVGLPEVNLGIIPGAGGTQRLPRLAGLEASLDMITSGKPVTAAKAQALGILDAVTADDILPYAIAFARAHPERPAPVSARPAPATDPALFAGWRESMAKKRKGEIAPQRAVDAVAAACENDFAAGMAFERAQITELRAGSQSAALRHLFFAERACSKVDGVDPKSARPVANVAVLGGGTMGAGIAIAHLDAGFPVTLLEINDAALDAGLSRIRSHYAGQVEKGRLAQGKADAILARLSGTTDYADLADVDLVIEAVFEKMEIKRDAFEKLDAICKPGCILATNTSYLDVNAIAATTKRPQSVVGLHFFSPANIMKLLEIVRGDATAPDVLATALAHGRKLGKTAVVSGVCFGFIGNRMLQHYQREVGLMLLEGATPAEIDTALTGFGMAMGPLAVADLAGIDIGYMTRKSMTPEQYEAKAFKVHDALVEMDRKGRKTGAGFYRYGPDAPKGDDPEVLALIERIAASEGVTRRTVAPEEIVERCMLALANEGAKIVAEGIAQRASDVDVVYVNGYGFPKWRGGPLHYAESLGADHVRARIAHYRDIFGPRWW